MRNQAAFSFAADIDGDGLQEVVNDRAVYNADGTLRCRNTAVPHGLAGVGNFDADSQGEIVVVAEGYVWLLDDDCSLRWKTAIPGGGEGGAPNIADFDNDGQPEIGVAGASRYAVVETQGGVRWWSSTQDGSSHKTGSSAFDFDGDGRSEVVYADETRLRIYDGATGEVRFETPNSSGTAFENPVIADVDGDNNAEIVVATNNYYFQGSAGLGAQASRRVLAPAAGASGPPRHLVEGAVPATLSRRRPALTWRRRRSSTPHWIISVSVRRCSPWSAMRT